MNLTLTEAGKMLEKLHVNEPGLRQTFHKEIRIAIESTNTLIAPNGRRRDFFDRIDPHAINEGISFLPQAIVSDQTKFSFIETFPPNPWAFLLAEAHDGALAEVPIGREQEFFQIYKSNIETPIDFRHGSLKRNYQLTIPCEGSVGENWEEMRSLD